MYEKILKLIREYETIIIHRHKNPDMDAYGSQLGLKNIIELNFPTKKVYVVGDENNFAFLGAMDVIDDSIYSNALVIVVDVAVAVLVSDDRYKLAKHVLVIDHHLNSSDIADTEFINSDCIACAQIIADIALTEDLIIDKEAATALFGGLATDSGRFLYPNTTAKSFEIAAYLARKGADIQYIYDNLYTESLNFKKLKGYFINNFKTTENKVAYMKNNTSVKDEFGVTTFIVSRAMVNQMSGIEGIEIWANFTMDEDGKVQSELRSKRIPIVDIAKKYGGGGHLLACGCTLSSFEDANLVLADLDQLLKEEIQNG
ncbi:MAG: bifunctional oligoribonuclease/PAP phosphatase NrnA [Epsilonproteobacteria bacterium]|nr:MAG: bifunctional oligoribonuclease/PAP phosphatase NrnA [Campylobacterota bacterium]